MDRKVLYKKLAVGALGKTLVEFGTSVGKALEKVGPETVFKALGYGLPLIAAMELINLEPTGEVIGEYMKNKLVPGMEESNKAREMELAATMEMGAKHLPALSAMDLEHASGRDRKRESVAKAMEKKESLLKELASDEFLSEVDGAKVSKLLDDIIQMAPVTAIEQPSVTLNILRSAALSGSDTIDLVTAQQLSRLEQDYTGGY